MTPQTGTALILIALFVLPGFVTLLIRERTHTIRGEETPFERLLNALYYSALIYAIAVAVGLVIGLDKSDLVEFYKGEKSLGEDLALAVLIALVLPAAISELGLLWRKSLRLRPWTLGALKISPAHWVSSAWNEAFSRQGTPMVRATLTDTRVVGGYFGFGSLAGYSEQTPDLFIAERWILDDDGWFVERADNTDGVWIGHENIVSVEFYKVPDEEAADTPDQQEAADAAHQQGAADTANEQGAVDIADPHDQADTPDQPPTELQ